MRTFLFLSISLFYSSILYSQTCADKIPDDWDFSKETDFAQYEADILECIDWLYSSKIGVEQLSRNKAIMFINSWGEATPTLLLFPYTKVSNWIFQDVRDNDRGKRYGVELYMSYYCGMVECLINNKKGPDLRTVHLAGIEKLLTHYENNKHVISNSKAVLEFSKLKKSGELEFWINKKITRKEIRIHQKFLKNGPDIKKKYNSKNPGAYPPI